jgi:hypothetical protein
MRSVEVRTGVEGWVGRAGWALALWLACAGCGAEAPLSGGEGGEQAVAEAGAPLRQVTDSGPLTVTLTVSPAAPMIGDDITLTITVEAAAGVEVKMPAYTESVGRFVSTLFAPTSQSILPDGRAQLVQQYTLQAPMSGAQELPAQVIEYVDRRPDRPASAEVFGEAQTPPLALEVGSALGADGDKAALHGLREAFPADEVAPPALLAAQRRLWWWLGAGAAALLIGALVWGAWRRLRRPPRPRSPFEVAWEQLERLRASGLPSEADADAWYVRLSGLVRGYLEGRFGLRAPELTTEEFLVMASQTQALQATHRDLLAELLSRADRVKFAAYVPPPQESSASLEAAARFIQDTRPVEGAAGSADASADAGSTTGAASGAGSTADHKG